MGNFIRNKTEAVYILLSILKVNIFIDLMFLVRILPYFPILTLPVPYSQLCDIPDAAMTGSFAFDDFCYAVDPKPRFGVKCEHNRTWHRLPQLLVKFMTEDRGLASKVNYSNCANIQYFPMFIILL